jgi:3-oxoadipate enol-lactonase
MRQAPRETETTLTRLAELPGRGVTRVWECAGPPDAQTLMLIHGLAATAELNWGRFSRRSRAISGVVAADLRGHGDGISAGSRFRLEDCADDVAALAETLDIGRFIAVGYSMGGMVAQLLYRRHAPLLSGLVLCTTAGDGLGSPIEKLAALAVLAMATAMRWNPVTQLVGAQALGPALLGPIDDPAIASWARDRLSRTTLAAAMSAIQAACEFTSSRWIGQVDVPTAVVVTTRDRIVPPAASLSWLGRSPAPRSTRWTPIMRCASPRHRCSPGRCSRHPGRYRLAAQLTRQTRPERPPERC